MSQRQDIEAKLALYDELTGILGAMRSFALAELRRIGKRELAQQRVVDNLAQALNDVATYLPASAVSRLNAQQPAHDIWLLLGSVRGFCSSFNEDVLQLWREEAGKDSALILVGERLHGVVAADNALSVGGANSGLDASSVIEAILEAVAQVRPKDDSTFGLVVCVRDEHAARCQRLWPLLANDDKPKTYPPYTLAPVAEVAVGVAEHYLYHTLLALLLRSIRVENHMRLMQMENALRHLDSGHEELQRRRNRLRQEEIVEEIELMAAGRRH